MAGPRKRSRRFMAFDLSKRFVIAVSTRALFDMARENYVFDMQGVEAYEKMQIEKENTPLEPGTAFPLIKAMMGLNDVLPEDRRVEVVLVSRSSNAASLRAWNSVKHHQLAISRGAFTSGSSVVSYLKGFKTDLFLSASGEDVETAFRAQVPAAMVYGLPKPRQRVNHDVIRVAFDGDAVLFDDEAERVFQDQGMIAFHKHEFEKAREPLREGPFAKLLLSLGYIQRSVPNGRSRIRTALITARNGPAHERVIRTLRDVWHVHVDETLFLGGIDKAEFLSAFEPHIFFDDQQSHCALASVFVPTAQVPSNLWTLTGAMAPPCPRCRGETDMRLARQGRNAGKPFYGCKAFPSCRGSVSIA